ncbi:MULTISPECIES: hypothetical protein [unclassified Rhizobium]|uniref:hypothetical protein n=1 Tax=unclassified Rhizobium TaxID=2613769 RepID=UPI000BE99D84|nr:MULTISPECIES: hypothetical protein [unclassified Rhizobium]MDF0659727.1 hypothetical protein [Rhizobium sp. BC49]PDS85258.1 hypothetical protein CO654_12345 [Rhizobium sp. L18]
MKLHQPRLKIDRANAKIAEARTVLGSTDVYQFVGRVDTDSGDGIIRLDLFDVSDLVHVIVGEVAYQLRSALDVAAVALARLNGATNVKHVYFPFAGTEHEFLAKGAQGKMAGLSETAKDVIVSFAPYRGGNDLLYGLNDLCNTDKHNNLIASILRVGNRITPRPSSDMNEQAALGVIAGLFASAMIDHGNEDFNGFEFKVKPYFGDPSELASLMNRRMPISIGLIFSGTDNLDGWEMFGTLSKMVDLVGSIVDRLEEASA